MATINGQGSWIAKGLHQTLWTPLTFSGTDVGTPQSAGQLSDKTVQAVGTFGAGGSVAIEGSDDGTNWTVLTDPGGTALNLTSAAPGPKTVLQNTRFTRPHVTAGDGTTSLTVIQTERSGSI